MQTSLLCLLFLAALPTNARISKFEWFDSGSPNVQFFDMDVNPSPILHPGPIELTLNASLLRSMSGKLRTDINIIRTISGLTLPIRW